MTSIMSIKGREKDKDHIVVVSDSMASGYSNKNDFTQKVYTLGDFGVYTGSGDGNVITEAAQLLRDSGIKTLDGLVAEIKKIADQKEWDADKVHPTEPIIVTNTGGKVAGKLIELTGSQNPDGSMKTVDGRILRKDIDVGIIATGSGMANISHGLYGFSKLGYNIQSNTLADSFLSATMLNILGSEDKGVNGIFQYGIVTEDGVYQFQPTATLRPTEKAGYFSQFMKAPEIRFKDSKDFAESYSYLKNASDMMDSFFSAVLSYAQNTMDIEASSISIGQEIRLGTMGYEHLKHMDELYLKNKGLVSEGLDVLMSGDLERITSYVSTHLKAQEDIMKKVVQQQK